MASKCIIARNKKRQRLNDKYEARRKELKTLIKNENADPDERMEAFMKLQKLPRNSARVRYRKRCMLTGRSRGNLSYFGLCRNEFRRLAHEGQLVGVTKSSW